MSILEAIQTTLPKYEVVIPSTGSKTTFRPFLMKEQRVLMMADSEKSSEMLLAIAAVVENCVDNVNDAKKIPMHDLEYLFCQIRSKSVSEMVEPIFTCPETGENVKIGIDLTKIEISRNNPASEIKINDAITFHMRSPMVRDYIEESNTDFDSILSQCVEKIVVEDEVYEGVSLSATEKETILENLTKEQYYKIQDYLLEQPKITMDVPYRTSDGTERSIKLEGMKDFFG
jgi:hypothetical protein